MSFGEGLDGGAEGKDRSTTIWGLGPKADHELQQEGETLVSRMYVHACVGVCICVYVRMCKSVACVCACVSMLVSVMHGTCMCGCRCITAFTCVMCAGV